MSLYDLNYSIYTNNMLPPQYRKPIWLAWFACILKPMQWLRDMFFDKYVESAIYTYWDGTTVISVTAYQLVRFQDNTVWEAQINIANITTDNPISTPTTTNWLKIQDDSIGLRERVKYNNQRIVFEYLLNRYFNPTDINPFPGTHTNGIYIQNSSNTNAPFVAGLTVGSYAVETASTARQWVKEYGFNNYSFTNFTIYVPNNAGRDGIAVFDLLGTNNANREAFIRSIADKYNIAGYSYDIKTY